MGLSSAIEFLAAQESESGGKLAQLGGTQLASIIPANTRLRVVATPIPSIYGHFTFRAMLDSMMVPGSLQLWLHTGGVIPYTGILYTSSRDHYLEFFLTVTQSQPIVYELVNLTNLNQWAVVYTQHLTVTTEDVWKELHRRLKQYFGMTVKEVSIMNQAQLVAPPPPLPSPM